MATEAEIAAFLEDVSAVVQESFAVSPAMIEALEAGIVEALSALPRPEAIAAARQRVADLVEQMGVTEGNRIGQTIIDGLENNLTPAQIKRELRDGLGATRNGQAALSKERRRLQELGLSETGVAQRMAKLSNKMTAERAATIAQNEIGNALEQGERAAALDRGSTHKISQSAGDGRVSDICKACVAAGLILINEEFPSGMQAPPHHLKCRCTASYVTEPSDVRAQRLNDRQAAEFEGIELAQAG